MSTITIPSGPLQGVKLEVAERRWGRARLIFRSAVRRRRRRTGRNRPAA